MSSRSSISATPWCACAILARGFIRAECFRYDDLIAHGSEKALREKGLFRLEGKEYVVKDGDIISVRFSV